MVGGSAVAVPFLRTWLGSILVAKEPDVRQSPVCLIIGRGCVELDGVADDTL